MKLKNMKPDEILKEYWRNNNRFADLFNQVLFSGKGYLDPEKLSDTDTEESTMIIGGEPSLDLGHSPCKEQITTISRCRDLIKQYADGTELVLIGLESQMLTHYAMPVRSMLYIGAVTDSGQLIKYGSITIFEGNGDTICIYAKGKRRYHFQNVSK